MRSSPLLGCLSCHAVHTFLALQLDNHCDLQGQSQAHSDLSWTAKDYPNGWHCYVSMRKKCASATFCLSSGPHSIASLSRALASMSVHGGTENSDS